MDECWKDVIMISVNIIIAITAIWAVSTSRKNFRLQIQIDRYERIYSIGIYLVQYYETIFKAYQYLYNYNQDTHTFSKAHREYMKVLETVREKKIDVRLVEQQKELELLTKSFMHGELKIELLAFCRYFKDMLLITLDEQWFYAEEYWKEGVLNTNEMNAYFESLEMKIVEAISFSNDGNYLSNNEIRKQCIDLFDIKKHRGKR